MRECETGELETRLSTRTPARQQSPCTGREDTISDGRLEVSNFKCHCGCVTDDDGSTSATSYVAYDIGELNAAETRVAAHAAAFMRQMDDEGRTAWLSSYFGPDYPTSLADHEVIEDITSRELNEGFTAMYRCPDCGRIALLRPGGWAFYRPE